MRRFSDRHSLQTLAELNVTPLLDLAFVLLIIFIITTPLMDNKTDVTLPSSSASQNAVNPADVQTITIDKDALVKLNGETVDLENLTSRLSELHQTRPETAAVIRSDRELPVQKLVDLMDAVQHAGISKVGVVTQPQQP